MIFFPYFQSHQTDYTCKGVKQINNGYHLITVTIRISRRFSSARKFLMGIESLTDTLNFRTVGYFLTNLINDPSSLKLQSRDQNLI
jgi:hypothetical protein